MKSKHYKKNNYIKIKIILIVIFIIGLIYIGIYLYQCYKDKLNNSNILSNITINKEEITPTKTEKMLQLEELKKQNDDIVGWLEIEGTNINYPVMQTTNNEYYMTHNYKKEYSAEGSIFLDKDYYSPVCSDKDDLESIINYRNNSLNEYLRVLKISTRKRKVSKFLAKTFIKDKS